MRQSGRKHTVGAALCTMLCYMLCIMLCAALCSCGTGDTVTDASASDTTAATDAETSQATQVTQTSQSVRADSDAVSESTAETSESTSDVTGDETSAETTEKTEETTDTQSTEAATESDTAKQVDNVTQTSQTIQTTQASQTSAEAESNPFGDVKLLSSYKGENDGNPLISVGYGADPYAMEYNGRIYVYMTNDEYEYSGEKVTTNTYAKIKSVRCISSDDMVNWTDHGIIKLAGADGACKWAKVSWAPSAVHKKINGKEKFFLYFTNGAMSIGVASSDSPTGPFTDPIGKALVTGDTSKGVNWVIDPAVAVDENGTGYLCYGGGFDKDKAEHPMTARIVKLTSDMTALDGVPETIDAPYMFEDSGFNIINGKYLFSYCSNWEKRPATVISPSEASIAYMVSDKPLTGYSYAGEILKNPGKFFGTYGNNHHCIVQFEGKWYIFYHAQIFEKKVTKKTDGYRSTHVDEIDVGEDGTVKAAKGTMKGAAQTKKLNPYERVSAATMSNCAGVSCATDGTGKATSVRGGWIKISGVDFGGGAGKFTAELGKVSGDGCIRVCADAVDGTVVSQASYGKNDKTVTSDAEISGVHDIYIEFSGESCELKSWSFEKK